MINYLITGGSGFIGSNLVRRLVSEKSGAIFIMTEKKANLWRLNDILSELIVFEVDLTDYQRVDNIIESIRPNVIFHLASYGGLPSQIEQRKVLDTNFYGTVNLLNACKKFGFDCFINTGSSSEYGIKISEMRETDIVTPISDYAVAKAAATQFCVKEALFNKLPIYTVRPFSVYGDYEMPGRLIPTILIGAMLHNQINLSSKSSVRDFIYVQDIVDFYLTLSKVMPTHDFVFNAGSGVQSTISDVVAAVELLTGFTLDVSWNSASKRPWEPQVWKASIDRAFDVLKWQPKYSLKQGLDKTLKWFEENTHFYEKNYDYTKPDRTKSISL